MCRRNIDTANQTNNKGIYVKYTCQTINENKQKRYNKKSIIIIIIDWNNTFNKKYWEIIGSILSGPQGDSDYRGSSVLQPLKCGNRPFYFPAKQAQKNEEVQTQVARSPRHTLCILMPSKEQKQRAGSDKRTERGWVKATTWRRSVTGSVRKEHK